VIGCLRKRGGFGGRSQQRVSGVRVNRAKPLNTQSCRIKLVVQRICLKRGEQRGKGNAKNPIGTGEEPEGTQVVQGIPVAMKASEKTNRVNAGKKG